MIEGKVAFAEQAECDLRNIFEYIAFSLLEPVVAKKQAGRIVQKIRELRTFPMRCPVFETHPWKEIGLRTLLVDNYSVLYLTDEQVNTVTIVRIMYSRRNIDTELGQTNLK